MKLTIKKPGKKESTYELRGEPITVGRSPDADIVLKDERASRLHCGIRFMDDEYFVRDLKSKNGTYLNGERIEMARLSPGDRIKIGSVVIAVEGGGNVSDTPGDNTVFNEVEDAMGSGKGYNTILKEIVDTTDQPPKREKP